MQVAGWIVSVLTVLAIFLGPIVALGVQRKIDNDREARQRKLWIFKTLMSLRATPIAPAYVQALNLIDVEFDSTNDGESEVLSRWKELLDFYCRADFQSFVAETAGSEKLNDLRAALLSAIGKCLGYQFDNVHLKKGVYYPAFLGNIESEQHMLRKYLLEIFDGSGRRKLPVALFEQKFPEINLPSKDTGVSR